MSAEDQAAQVVRQILETLVMPHVGLTLKGTLTGEAVRGCTHLVDAPGSETQIVMAVFDWMCEGVGLMCRDCALHHMTEPGGKHTDPRHECCIVCGHVGQDLNSLAAPIILGKPVMVSSVALDALSEIRGQKMALGYVGSMVTSPIVWECPAHDGFLDSEVELFWPPTHDLP